MLYNVIPPTQQIPEIHKETPAPTSISMSPECVNSPKSFLPNVDTHLRCYYILNIDKSPKQEFKITIMSLNDNATGKIANFIIKNGGSVTASYSVLLDGTVTLDMIDDLSTLEGISLIGSQLKIAPLDNN